MSLSPMWMACVMASIGTMGRGAVSVIGDSFGAAQPAPHTGNAVSLENVLTSLPQQASMSEIDAPQSCGLNHWSVVVSFTNPTS